MTEPIEEILTEAMAPLAEKILTRVESSVADQLNPLIARVQRSETISDAELVQAKVKIFRHLRGVDSE